MPKAFKKPNKGIDVATEGILYLILVVSPWLFGATDLWAIWLTNGLAYLLGIIALWRRATFRELNPEGGASSRPGPQRLIRALASLNLLFLVYMTVAAANARADFHMHQLQFTYFDNFSWLPTTYHRSATLLKLSQVIALTCLFWSLRAWLLNERRSRMASNAPPDEHATPVPARMRRLLWVLGINGALLAIVAILQRSSGTDKIFGLFETRWGDKWSIFGPFPYRGNAADYFNLVWPVILSFSVAIWPRGSRKSVDGPHLLLVVACILICAAPIISLSRGGALVTMGMLALIALRYFPNLKRRTIAFLLLPTIAAVGLTWQIAGQDLWARFKGQQDSIGERKEQLINSAQIARDFPVYGIGPGAFGAVYHMYRADMSQRWLGYLHNDWLEARLTFGWTGFSIQLALLVCVCGMAVYSARRQRRIAEGIALALFGCGTHALADFPFQIHSILLLFTAWCAILCAMPFIERQETSG